MRNENKQEHCVFIYANTVEIIMENMGSMFSNFKVDTQAFFLLTLTVQVHIVVQFIYKDIEQLMSIDMYDGYIDKNMMTR